MKQLQGDQSGAGEAAKEMIGQPSVEAIDFAKRMIALKWTKETNVDIVAANWQAGYFQAQVDVETFKDAYIERNDAYNKANEEKDNLAISFAAWVLYNDEAASLRFSGATGYQLLEKYKSRPYIDSNTSNQ